MSGKSILVVGLTFDPAALPEPMRGDAAVADVVAKVKASLQEVKDAGYDLHLIQITPKDPEPGIEEVKEKLRSKEWDAFAIGMGVRGRPEFTDMFEKLLNASREICPKARMIFNSGPTDLLEALKRNGM